MPYTLLLYLGLLDQSIYPITHRSDAVRVAILWRRGGICIINNLIICNLPNNDYIARFTYYRSRFGLHRA